MNIINMEKSYTHLYNRDHVQNHLTKCTGEDFLAKNIMKYKNKNLSKGFNYKIYLCGPLKGWNKWLRDFSFDSCVVK